MCCTPCLITNYCGWEKKKAQHPVGLEPVTSLLRGVLSTTVLHLLPIINLDLFERKALKPKP